MGICIRCGKDRIVVSSRQELVGTSMVTITETECSDPGCQKIVERTLKNEEIKRNNMIAEKERQNLLRKELKDEASE